MKPALITFCYVIALIIYVANCKRDSSSSVHKGINKKSASNFLSFKECMKKMKCGPSLYSECAEECSAGNTKEEIEEHTERLKHIKKFIKDARNKELMSKRLDTDFSDSSSSDDSSESTEGSSIASSKQSVCKLSPEMKKMRIPNAKAAMFLSYHECMKRMNCGKQLRKQCSEECKEGNTEEEVEEHGSFLRNIDKFITEAKRRQKMKDLDTSDSSSDSSSSDDSSSDSSSSDDTSDESSSDGTDVEDNTNKNK